MRQSTLEEYGNDGYDCPCCDREFETARGRSSHFPHAHPDKNLTVKLFGAEVLIDLYVEQALSTRMIGERLGVSAPTIQNALEYLGIDRRSRAEAGEIRWEDERNTEAAVEARRKTYAGLTTDNEGYERWVDWTNWKDTGSECVKVHRLLATLLVDDLSELDGMDIHHKSGVPWDNRLGNLEVLSHGEHMRIHLTKNDTS